MLSNIRIAGYIGGFLAVLAAVLSALGWGTYNAATGMFQPPPINVYAVGALAGAGLTNLMAAIAVFRRWGR